MGKFMNERTKKGLEILQAALVLGILGDTLLRATPWGLNFFLWVTALSIGLWVVVARHRKERSSTSTILLHGALIFFAAMFIWRASIELMLFDVLAILMILAVLTLPAMKLKMQQSGLAHYALGWVYSGLNIFLSPLFLFVSDIRFETIPRNKGTRHFTAALRGLLVAIPILLIFGALFVAADAAFQELIEKTFRIDFALVINHLALISVMSWIVAGYLRGSAFFGIKKEVEETPDNPEISLQELDLKEKSEVKDENAKEEKPKTWDLQDINNSFLPQYFTLGTVELSVALGLMNLLFLSFVIVQIPYLFGGIELVQNTENLKLAEYARRGFGELVLVSALVLPTLMAAHWLIRKDDKTTLRIYQVLAAVQIGLLFVIMLSAAQRMLLYTGTSGYGLTTARFYPMALMIWLAIVFLWFAATVLRGQRARFAWGTLWSALVFLAAVHVFNPDDFIARTNFNLMHQGRSIDTRYLTGLSDDAIPALLEEMPNLNSEQQCTIQKRVLRRLERGQAQVDLRSWNWSREQARNKIKEQINGSELPGCEQSPEPKEEIRED
jgi:hypothetical protein